MRNPQEGLQELAARQHARAPWSFEEFEQRRARATAARRNFTWSAATSMVALAVIAGIAVLTQPPVTATVARRAAQAGETVAAAQAGEALPALVDMGQFDVTSELEDRIALLDAEISAARVQQVPVEQLRPIEITREQLNDSLQRVSYAHTLLGL